jgi:uncharacterized peroxidase-related enzyme
MTIIRTPEDDEVTGATAEIYAADRDDYGYVASHTRLMAMNLDAYQAWESLARSVARPLGTRRYELVTLAAARGAGSVLCRLAHGRKSLSVFSEDQLERVARDHHDAGLSGAEVAMMDFAEQVSRDATALSDEDSETLRRHGFTDREIVDIALAAAARNYYSRAIAALGADVEVVPGLSPRLVSALTDGL